MRHTAPAKALIKTVGVDFSVFDWLLSVAIIIESISQKEPTVKKSAIQLGMICEIQNMDICAVGKITIKKAVAVANK